MGTPEFAVETLKALVENDYNVVAVVTQPDKAVGRHQTELQPSEVKKYALEHNLPVLQPVKMKDPEFVEQLRSYQANLQVVVAFRMLPEVVWDMPQYGTFNVHAALLPQRREPVAAPRENLVRIRLVPDIPDELILRELIDAVECQRELDRAEARREMAARLRDCIDHELADFGRELLELGYGELLHIVGFLDPHEQRIRGRRFSVFRHYFSLFTKKSSRPRRKSASGPKPARAFSPCSTASAASFLASPSEVSVT